MTRFVLISLCIVFAVVHRSEQACGDQEVENDCPSHDHCYRCPTKDGQYKDCQTPSTCGAPKCTCRFNERKGPDGTCIRTEKCPPFQCNRPNEEYVACPPYCPTDNCNQSTPHGRCPLPGRIGIVVECIPACRCIKGYWRQNGTCVPYDECKEHASTRFYLRK